MIAVSFITSELRMGSSSLTSAIISCWCCAILSRRSSIGAILRHLALGWHEFLESQVAGVAAFERAPNPVGRAFGGEGVRQRRCALADMHFIFRSEDSVQRRFHRDGVVGNHSPQVEALDEAGGRGFRTSEYQHRKMRLR